jgi:hypothetical protein
LEHRNEKSSGFVMNDLHQALSEIHLIRHQVARGTQFRGYGPASIAFSSMLALGAAWAEMEWGGRTAHNLTVNLVIWVAVAIVSIALSGLETFARARRVHFDLAQEMLHSAIEQFVPALIAGFLLTIVLLRTATSDCWLLPGLWELIFSLGIFASCRFLPRAMFAVGVWYLAAGLCSVIVASGPKTFLPWTMGLPFGIGQLFVAAVLHLCIEDSLEET